MIGSWNPILAVTAVLSFCCIASAEEQTTQYTDDDFEISYPFVSDEAKRRFMVCYPETKPEEMNGLEAISYWGYRFYPHEGCAPWVTDCNPDVEQFKTIRTVRVDANQGNPSRVRASAFSVRNGSCTSPVEIHQLSQRIDRKQVRYDFHARARKRACALGGSVTLGEKELDIAVGANLSEKFEIIPFNFEYNSRGRLLGISGSFLEQLFVLTIVGLPPLAILVADIVIEHNLADVPAINVLDAGFTLERYIKGKYAQDVGNAGNYAVEFRMQLPESGFALFGDDLKIEYFQEGYQLKVNERSIKDVRKLEIDFLKSLNDFGASSYTVRPGDNLWRLTAKRFGDPRLFLIVAELSKLDPKDALRVGDVIELPKWHQLCEKLKGRDKIVKYGESLWAKARDGQIPQDLRLVKTRSGRNNLIYPYEELIVKEVAK